MGLQRVVYDWVTELNWTDPLQNLMSILKNLLLLSNTLTKSIWNLYSVSKGEDSGMVAWKDKNCILLSKYKTGKKNKKNDHFRDLEVNQKQTKKNEKHLFIKHYQNPGKDSATATFFSLTAHICLVPFRWSDSFSRVQGVQKICDHAAGRADLIWHEG